MAAREEGSRRLQGWRGPCFCLLLNAPQSCLCLPPDAARSPSLLGAAPQAEIKRRRGEARGDKKNAKAVRMPGKNASSFD